MRPGRRRGRGRALVFGGCAKAAGGTQKSWKQILAALENGDVPAAIQIAKDSPDPIIRMIYRGLNHVHTSLQGALQLAAGIELERAGRFLTVMDTLVTLAPLLGLLGTVTGLMRAFLSVGSAELSVVAVTGGIGEALIATACGLGIAIVSLIPFNYFTGRLTRLQFELEAAATNVEMMVAPKADGGGNAEVGSQAPHRIARLNRA